MRQFLELKKNEKLETDSNISEAEESDVGSSSLLRSMSLCSSLFKVDQGLDPKAG